MGSEMCIRDRMQEEGVPASVVTYNAVLRAADWPVALSLLEDMRDDAALPGSDH